MQYDAGTQTPADYTSVVTVTEGDGHFRATVSMNHILCHRGLRLYQSGYDEDGHGTSLLMTYFGVNYLMGGMHSYYG